MLKSNSETLSRVMNADLSIQSRGPSGLLRSQMLFKGCGDATHLCKQCDKVLPKNVRKPSEGWSPLLFESPLMISGTDCGQRGEMWRNLTHRTQTASWQHATYQSLFAVPFELIVRAPVCLRMVFSRATLFATTSQYWFMILQRWLIEKGVFSKCSHSMCARACSF
jgi:hypothetical protein